MYDNGSSQSDGHHGRSKSKQSSSGLPSDSSNGMGDDDCYSENRTSNFSASGGYDDPGRMSAEGSPMMMSPWNNVTPFQKSSWIVPGAGPVSGPQNALVGSLVREEGHIYSLATRRGDLLYTGSDSKNIRVWKNLKEFSGFKSASGLVKAIVISGEKIFTGHQDGKIRVWKVSSKNPSAHKRYGSLPTLKDLFKSSMKPSNYVEVKRNRSALWIKHSDAISCMSLDEEKNLLYSASWDRTVKVWKIGDSKCLESVAAHTDAVNSVVTGSGGLVFTGSADGTVKVWRREEKGSNIKSTKHVFMQTLLKQETAVTALAVDPARKTIYCGSSDGLVNFWEVERNLAHGGVMKGHKLAVLCLSAVGKLVFSGSADKNICVWRREEGAGHVCISVLSGHTGPVKCLAVEEDREAGERDKWKVYSGSLDKSVKVWSVSEQMMSSMNMMMDGEESVESERPSDFM